MLHLIIHQLLLNVYELLYNSFGTRSTRYTIYDMNLSKEYLKRSRELRDRLYLARIPVAFVARKLGKARNHVSMVLNGRRESKSLLDEVENLLEEYEDKHDYALAA